MASIPPFYTDAVVAIGYERNGRIIWGASGFFYFHTLKDDQGRVYLVTNKHVLKGNNRIFLRVNPKALGEPKGYALDLIDASNGSPLWKGHSKKQVDVAVIPVNFELFQREEMQVNCFHDVKHTLDVQGMESDGQSEGDGVFVLGFPVSVVGNKSKSAVIRAGIIARLKDTFKSATQPFLIDTTVFPGNSGGPVVNKPEFMAIEGTKSIQKASLIGVVASYMPYRDVAVSSQTGNPRVIFEENSGLSNVFSVDCIRTTIRSFERQLSSKVKLAVPEKSQRASEEPTLEDNPVRF